MCVKVDPADSADAFGQRAHEGEGQIVSTPDHDREEPRVEEFARGVGHAVVRFSEGAPGDDIARVVDRRPVPTFGLARAVAGQGDAEGVWSEGCPDDAVVE